MFALPATSSATPSLQSTLNRNRLEQARREADQLEARAQNLRTQADQAEGEAKQGQAKIRSLSSQVSDSSSTSNTGDATYNTAVKSSSTAEVPAKVQDFLVRMYTATSPQFAASGNALKTTQSAAPVVNTSGQSTGRIVNIEV
jgi:hypothetical protein